jgi:hypothetical protein
MAECKPRFGLSVRRPKMEARRTSHTHAPPVLSTLAASFPIYTRAGIQISLHRPDERASLARRGTARPAARGVHRRGLTSGRSLRSPICRTRSATRDPATTRPSRCRCSKSVPRVRIPSGADALLCLSLSLRAGHLPRPADRHQVGVGVKRHPHAAHARPRSGRVRCVRNDVAAGPGVTKHLTARAANITITIQYEALVVKARAWRSASAQRSPESPRAGRQRGTHIRSVVVCGRRLVSVGAAFLVALFA